MHTRITNLEKGQSLVEFVIMVPLFFIVLSGVNLYLNQEIKSLTEDSAHESLIISDSHFDDKERIIAGWNGSTLSTSDYNSGILDNVFNSSKYFSEKVDMEDGVFRDKKNISNGVNTDCTKNPSYKLNSSHDGKFIFSSCADGSGFENEKTKFSYQNIFEDFKTTNKLQDEESSIYYPKSESFVWKNRPSMIRNAVIDFSALSIPFQSNYASLLLPKDKAKFNAKCLMNPKTSSCSIPPLIDLWNLIVLESDVLQLLACETEAIVLKCGGPEDIPCVVLVQGDIALSVISGKAPKLCPLATAPKKLAYPEVIMQTYAKILETLQNEADKRGELLF